MGRLKAGGLFSLGALAQVDLVFFSNSGLAQQRTFHGPARESLTIKIENRNKNHHSESSSSSPSWFLLVSYSRQQKISRSPPLQSLRLPLTSLTLSSLVSFLSATAGVLRRSHLHRRRAFTRYASHLLLPPSHCAKPSTPKPSLSYLYPDLTQLHAYVSYPYHRPLQKK